MKALISLLLPLYLGVTFLPLEVAYARQGRNRGSSPRLNSSVRLQNQGNLSNFQRQGRSSSQNRSNSSNNWGSLSGNRQGSSIRNNNNNRGNSNSRQGNINWSNNNRQGNRNNNNNRNIRISNNDVRINTNINRRHNWGRYDDWRRSGWSGNRWYGGGWYGRGYYVPPRWGAWATAAGVAGLATGLAIGSTYSSPPPNYTRIQVSGTPFIYSDGVFMQPQGSNYMVVSPPIGAVVSYLPDGCDAFSENGIDYYDCSGVYYQPFFQSGDTVYRVVQLST